jgi:hypothetical protein
LRLDPHGGEEKSVIEKKQEEKRKINWYKVIVILYLGSIFAMQQDLKREIAELRMELRATHGGN